MIQTTLTSRFIPAAINILPERVRQLLLSGKLKGRLARGGMWLGVGGGFEYSFRLIRNVILARIMAPEAFGLMAIVLAFHNFFESFTQIGIKEAVIQSPKGNEELYLNGAFWLSFFRGVILFLSAYLIIPFVAGFYKNPELIPMMRLAFTSILFLSAMNPWAYSMLKQMHYKTWVFVYHGGSVLGIIIAIVLGFLISNTWALVIGFTFENFFRCVLSYILCRNFPRWRFEKESLSMLFKFAKGMAGVPILVFLYGKCDVFVIGKLCSAKDLGMYYMSYNLVQVPILFFGSIIPHLLLPTFSNLQDNLTHFSDSLMVSSRYILMFFLPLYAGMAIFSSVILSTLYGSEYSAVSVVFMILCASAFIKSLGVIINTAFFALGRPQLTRRASILRLIILVILIVPAVSTFGLKGAATASLIAGFVWIIYSIFQVKSVIYAPDLTGPQSVSTGK